MITATLINERDATCISTVCDATHPLQEDTISPTVFLRAHDISEMFTCAIDNLFLLQHQQFVTLLRQFHGSFDFPQTSMGHTSTVVHHVDTGTQAPLRQRLYRILYADRQVINTRINDML